VLKTGGGQDKKVIKCNSLSQMPNVTLFKDITDTTTPLLQPVERVLGYIKDGRWKDKVEAIRNCTDEEQQDKLKLTLPCVLYAGEFTINVKTDKGTDTCRKDECLAKHSHLVPIDIDDIDNIDEIIETLRKDHFIYALWKSPTGKGCHGLVKIGDGKNHRRHYTSLLQKYKFLDSTARNESRVLFASYDPDIYINPRSSTYYQVEDEPKAVTESALPISGQGFTDYKKVDVACKMVRLATDGEKHNVLLKASVLLGGYIASGKVEREVAETLLYHEISKRDIKNDSTAKNTISDGITYGMMMPIHEMEEKYAEAIEFVGSSEDELSFLSSTDDDELYIRKFRQGLIESGKGFGYEELDKHFVLKEAEFYAFVAHSNVGKTTSILWFLLVSAVNHGWNWMIYTGENTPASIKMKLIEYLTGRKIKEVPEHWLKYAIRFVNDHFYLITNDKTYEYKELLGYAETLSKRKSLKGIFIDPYNSLKANISATKTKYIYDYEAYSDMLAFTNRTKITLFLSAHTGTEAQRMLDNDGNQKMPHATMVEGGVALYNKVHNFIVFHRKIKDADKWMYTEVSVDKVRNKDTGGEPTIKGQPILLKMNKAVEFIDEQGRLPFERDFLPTYEEEKTDNYF
jgi:hypothetical protein